MWRISGVGSFTLPKSSRSVRAVEVIGEVDIWRIYHEHGIEQVEKTLKKYDYVILDKYRAVVPVQLYFKRMFMPLKERESYG